MAAKRINIEEFVRLASTRLVIDVRSPKEYLHAHIPQAISIPLFSDEERKQVGTTYKQQSREEAIKLGLDFYGPKMKSIVCAVEEKLKDYPQKSILVHCWRGGMRSAAVAWLLDLYGFEVYTLEGGYKSFRNWVLTQFEKQYKIQILGGNTGSGKTEILEALQHQNQAVINLEKLAQHKGSAFGNLDGHFQNSTEHFENKLALELYAITQNFSNESPIWLESESSRIGLVNIPYKLFEQMKSAPRINIKIPFEKRLEFICQSYGSYDKQAMVEATRRIKKRLGGLRMQQCITYFNEGDIHSAFAVLLTYYDQAYEKSRKSFCGSVEVIELPDTHYRKNATVLLEHFKKISC